jgi:hypothetical protein
VAVIAWRLPAFARYDRETPPAIDLELDDPADIR